MAEQALQKVEHRQSLLVAMANKYQMDPDVFKNTIKATVMPSNATNEQMAAFLLVANQYDLNPITKEIYAFPAKGGGVTPVVGVDGWINLAQRRHEFDGLEFEYTDDSVTCRIYRKDRSRPIVVTEFLDECRRPTEPWKTHPKRMLRHKATIQAIRYAFGFSGIRDEDDAEVIAVQPERVVSVAAQVVDLNARLEHETKESDAKDEQWPTQINGIWSDSRGVVFNADVHGMSAGGVPAVTNAGAFTKRRGCDSAAHARYEREAMAALSGAKGGASAADEQSQGAGQTAAQGGLEAGQDGDSAGQAQVFGYQEIDAAIRRATYDEELDDAEDMLRDFAGPEAQVYELDQAIAHRRERIGKIANGGA